MSPAHTPFDPFQETPPRAALALALARLAVGACALLLGVAAWMG